MKVMRRQFLILLIFISIITITPLYSLSQSIESAREKYYNENYEEALEELNAILESDSENIEALELFNEIDQFRKKKRSDLLTEKALIDIGNREFESAFKYLEEAILIDPENIRARELYLSIHEIAEIEQEVVEEEKMKEELLAKKEEEKGEEQLAMQIAEKEKEEPYKRYDTALLKVSTSYTFANSNKLDYIDSRVSMIGAKLDARYYFDFLGKRLGLSVDYSGYPLKTYGNENINFVIHRVNVSARFRTFFFEDVYSRLTVGARLNYHLFYLQNLMAQGAYNFKQINGPSIGVFVSDPVIYRFIKNDFFRDFGFEGEFNYLFLLGQGVAPSSLEFYIGTYYNLKRIRFSLGYRLYSINKGSISESYHDIEVSAGYMF